MTTLRLIAEIAFGVLYSVGAVFHTVYTVRHTRKFYGAFLAGAWHAPARWFLRTIIFPHAKAFTVSLIVFQIAVAIMILARGDLVRVALVAGAIFSAAAAVVSSPGGSVGNLSLAAIQVALAVSR